MTTRQQLAAQARAAVQALERIRIKQRTPKTQPRLTPRQMLARVVEDVGDPPFPIYFRTRCLVDSMGHTAYYKDKIVIVLDHGLTYAERQDTVTHELAHAYIPEIKDDDHSPIWGALYARMYTAINGGH